MKRRSFIKGTALGGVGISSFSNIQEANKKSDINSEFYVTIDEQKVSFYSNIIKEKLKIVHIADTCLLYTSPSPRDKRQSRMPSSA